MFKLQRLEITGFKSFADYTEVVFTGNGITAVVGPNGCGKCVSGETLVTLADGREVEIRKLVEGALDACLITEQFDDGCLTRENPGSVEIITLNPKSLKLENRRVSAFVRRESPEHLLRIRTRAGREITATAYHPLFTLENGKLRALRADELTEGVRIATPRILRTPGRRVMFTAKEFMNGFREEDNVYLPFSAEILDWTQRAKTKFGTLESWARESSVEVNRIRSVRIGQAINVATAAKFARTFEPPPFLDELGSRRSGKLRTPRQLDPELARVLGLIIAEGRSNDSNSVWFVNSDVKLNQFFNDAVRHLFGLRVVQRNYKPNATDSLVFSATLGRCLEKLFGIAVGSNSFTKKVPEQIMVSDAETKWAFLSGLFEGDAYVCSRAQRSNGKALNYVEYTTASEQLATQIITLLLQFGIVGYLRPKRKCASNIKNRTVRTYYSVLVYGSRQLKHLANGLSFIGMKQSALNRLRAIDDNDNPNRDLVPSANKLVREAATLARARVKPNRKRFPKLAAYTGEICEPSRAGLFEVANVIRSIGDSNEAAEPTLNEIVRLAESDLFWDEIASVEKITPKDKWVYDLSIDETHNFVAGNIIVHNSNVSESIAWVLGEQRAKALRGSEMKDVVFQGTRTRKPSGMAEVVLHLVRDDEMSFIHDEEDLSGIDEAISELDENAVHVEDFEPEAEADPAESSESGESTETPETESSETAEIAQAAQVGSVQIVEKKVKPKRHWRPRSFALDFAPGEAIAVTRRLYLSGESEYLLNGKTCRLRDIQDLFAGTGLSGSHYAIIEQGRIGQILSAKPSDRRNLIEEAAGISKFRTRQRAAEARLESAKTNLSRITDIVAEIEKQANSLRRQAAKTRRYKILREEFRVLLRQLFTAEGKHFSALVGELESKLKEAVAAEHEVYRRVAEKEEEFREATRTARLAEEQLGELRQKHSANALDRDRNERERIYRLEQIESLKFRAAVLGGEIESGAERLAGYESEIGRLKKDEQKELAEAQTAVDELKTAEGRYRTKIERVRAIESKLDTIRNEVTQHTAAFERFTEIDRQLEHNLDRLAERSEGLVREGIRAQETLHDHTAEVERLAAAVREKSEKVTSLIAEKHQLVSSSGEARARLQNAERVLAELRSEFARKKNRLETLRELDEKRAVYAPSVQKLFADQAKIGVRFQGTLADRLAVDERAERAIESLFGTYLQTVLVESESDARKTVAYLSSNNLGRIGVLVAGKLNSAAPKTSGGNTNWIAELLGASAELRAVLTEVFPREMGARLIDSIATDGGDPNAVDVGGDVAFGGKLFIAGKATPGEKNSSLLAFKRELRELEAAIAGSTGAITEAESAVEGAKRELAEREESLVDLQSLIVQVERDLLSLEIQEKTARQETERAERHKRVVAEEATRIGKETADFRERQLQARESMSKADAARVNAEKMFAEVSIELNDARAEAESEAINLSEKRTSAAMSEERRRSAQNALRRVENEFREYSARREAQILELEETRGKQTDLTVSIASIEKAIADGESALAGEENELTAANEHLTKARATADAMSVELAELNKNSAEARNVRAALEIRQAESVSELRHLNENCTHELSISLAELVESEEVEADFELDDARRRVADLREKLENFGAINMLALEELSDAEERLLFLTSQRQDIVDSIRATEEALREIKERSRDRFKQAFEAINANFSEFFMELFGGGRGEMTLLEADDILDAGIEVVAQPPGKRLQNILLLSGGEKAMTAIALVMAIFKYRPSPFCLLDEVDAPLDDANVGRFVDKVAQMAEKTQFIVITHNKRTMEAARALYGVTMQEAGVSKVVSVRFE